MEQIGSFYFEGTNDLGVVIYPGLSRTPDDMREMGRYLNNLGYTVSCPEYQGHGTDESEFLNTDVKMWFEDAEKAFLELESKVKGIYVMGLSMGGTFTVRLSQTHNVLGLVTMNAPLIGLPLKEEFINLKETSDDIKQFEKSQISFIKYNKFVIETGQINNLNNIMRNLWFLNT